MSEHCHVEFFVKESTYDLRNLTNGKVCVYRDGKYDGNRELEEFMSSLTGEKFEVFFHGDGLLGEKMEVHDDATLDDVIGAIEIFL